MKASLNSQFGWYLRRLARMSPAEMLWRVRDHIRRMMWSRRQVMREQLGKIGEPPAGERGFTVVLPPETAAQVPEAAKDAILATAERLLRGEWEVLGVVRTDLVLPDWFRDPVTGRRSAPHRYAFRINHRSRGAGRQRQAGLGDLALAASHAAGHCLVPHSRREDMRTGWPIIFAPGGGRIPSCQVFTGRAASSSASV